MIFFPGAISLGSVEFPSTKIVINLPWRIINICSAVCQDLKLERQLDRQTCCYFYVPAVGEVSSLTQIDILLFLYVTFSNKKEYLVLLG